MNNENENNQKSNQQNKEDKKSKNDVEFNDVLKDVAKFAGRTFHDVERIFGDIYSDFMGKERTSEEKTLKQKLSDDLEKVYAELGKASLPHLNQNDAFGDDNLKNIIIKIERFKKGLQDLSDIENEEKAKEKAETEEAAMSATAAVKSEEQKQKQEQEQEQEQLEKQNPEKLNLNNEEKKD
ncbi:MAG: hypothetical protein HQK51_08125 [Oligoflexia bacterium]|nr:hypothetical protein [Oligoflexia bacterium]